jgi:hypothetical protein
VKLQIYNRGRYFFKDKNEFPIKFRSQELSQLNEKLRLQLAEKEGTITTLTRVHQPNVSVHFNIQEAFEILSS